MSPNEFLDYAKDIRDRKNYAAARYDPTLPHCGNGVHLEFNGANLFMVAIIDNFTFVGTYRAVSGMPDGKGNFDYSLKRQVMKDEGPIPEGKYWIDPSEFEEVAMRRRASFGNHSIKIHPFDNTNTFGSLGRSRRFYIERGGFYIHGGKKPGSIGCIDLTGEMDRFYQDLMQAVKQNPKCHIQLMVKYK